MSHALRVPPPLTAAGLRGLFATEQLPHDDVLGSIGGHYGGIVQAADPLDDAARELFDLAGRPCELQAERLAELLFLRFALSPDEHSADGLILPAVLVTRSADPLVIAMLGHEIARRAGIESRVCIAGDHAWTAILDSENCTLVGAAPLAFSVAQECDFHVACAHEAALLLLERLALRGTGCAATCAASIAGAMRSGQREVAVCPGHPRRF